MGDFVQTRGSQVKRDAVESFQSVIYEARKKKVKVDDDVDRGKAQRTGRSDKNGEEHVIDPKKKQEIEMKRARYDVMKFGISGFKKETAENAKVALAVSLGAKRPKNKAVNYKILMQQRKKEKEVAKGVKEVSGLSKSLVKHKSKKDTRKGRGGILGRYGKVQKDTVKKK